jgi:hypothetical protein
MQNIILDVGNNAKNILPVPYQKSPTPSVESPMYYGDSPYPMALHPTSRKNDDSQYCNFLSPAPRDQRLNVPNEGNKFCESPKNQPYSKDSCYLMDSKSQGVVGIVCNQPGGSDNSNFKRGNQFGVKYPYNVGKKVEIPVQIPMEMQNPMMVYDNNNNTFYPEPSFLLRKNKDFLTYPLQQNYTENGYPTYRYPYQFENFENPINNKKQMVCILLFILILILIILL